MRSVRLLGRLSLAHARRHRARMMLLGAGVMVGVASITAVLALSRSVIDTFAATLVHGAGAAQLQVSNGTAGLDRDLVDVIARLPGVAATGATVEHHVVLPAANRRITIFGAELGRDEAYREAQFGRDVAGIHDVLTFLAHTDSIALSPALLAANGWKIGDTIDVVGVRGQRTLTIRGAVRSQGFLQAFGGDVALMDLDAAQLQFEAGDRVHWIDVVVAQGADVETVQTTIAAALQGRGVVETPAARGRRMDELLSMLRVLLTGTNVVAMIVGIFLIHHALAQSYRQRRADFVRLRALGLSRWGLVAYVVTEAAALGIVASLAGVLAGIGFWCIATRDFAALVSMQFVPIPVPTLSLGPAECGGAIVLGTITVVIGAVAPLFGIVRHRPMEIVAQAQLPRPRQALASAGLAIAVVAASVLVARRAAGLGFAGQITVIVTTAGLVFVGSTLLVPLLLLATQPLLSLVRRDSWALLGRWTWLQACRSRLHTATTMGALAAGVTFAVALTVLLGSYRDALQKWFREVFADDVFVSAGPVVSPLGANSIDPELAREIERLDTVDHVSRWRFVQIQFRGAPIIVQAMAEEILARTF
ncbi:MAG: ABC transporter permease, partial [Deltaproteobacteria bacterium]